MVQLLIVGHATASYPLLAQVTGCAALTVATAACCQRTRYANLDRAITAPVSLAATALAWFAPATRGVLATHPASARTATIAGQSVCPRMMRR